MDYKQKLAIFIMLLILIMASFLPFQSVMDYFKFTWFFKNDLIINLYAINKQACTLSADSSNKMFLCVEVRDSSGNTVPNIPVNFETKKNTGKIYPMEVHTDKSGEAIVTYIPPSLSTYSIDKDGNNVSITARIHKTPITSVLNLSLTKPPVVLVHGYQEHPDIFNSMKDYLDSKGFNCSAFAYNSGDGVIKASAQFDVFLQKLKSDYLAKGIQVNKFDVITHSLGGLVTRYYTSGKSYLKNNDVEKIIFVSVPHRGSYWATLGTSYFNDEGIKDLVPENNLLSKILPQMFNKGLNNAIQVGSVLGQYDEVVTPESASLDEWNIKTEVFNVGENNLTMDNLLNGNILEAPNHKNVLFNKKVFEKIEEMLNKNLPYPSSKNN